MNIIKVLYCKALIDPYINHEELVSVNDALNDVIGVDIYVLDSEIDVKSDVNKLVTKSSLFQGF